MEQNKEYYAFISYKREDEKWAKWLQDRLEHYKFPTNLNGRTGLPKNIRPTFRDVTDSTPGFLEKVINNALLKSEWLIVICSPRSAKSPWVCKEAQTFIDLGRADHIIPFIIEGIPFSNDVDTECYPDALLNLTGSKELLAANISEGGRDFAAVKVVAKMFDLNPDTLWQRYERYMRNQRNKKFALVVGILLLFAIVVSIWAYRERMHNMDLKKANWKMMENQTRAVVEKAVDIANMGDSYLALKLICEIFPNKENGSRPYCSEIATALRQILLHDNAILKGHTGGAYYATLSPDESKIVSAAVDSTIRIWDFKSGECIKTIPLKHGHVLKVFFTYNKIYAFSKEHSNVNLDATLYLTDINTGRVVRVFRGQRGSIYSADVSKDKKYILSSSSDGTIYIWNSKTGSLHMVLKGHDSSVFQAFFSPNTQYVISGGRDGIRKWDITTGLCVDSIKNVDAEEMCISPDAKRLYIALRKHDQRKHEVVIWDFRNWKFIDAFKGYEENITGLSVNNRGDKLVVSFRDRTVNVIDVIKKSNIKVINGHFGVCYSPQFTLNGDQIVYSCGDGTIQIRDIVNRAVSTTLCKSSSSLSVKCISFSPDGSKLVVGTGLEVKLYDAHTRKCIKKIGNHRLSHISVDFSSDGEKIASVSDDTIRIWDSNTGSCLKKIPCKAYFSNISFSPNSQTLASVSDSTIFIWNVKTGNCLNVLKGHHNYIESIMFSPNGKDIASASRDGTIRIWDVNSAKVKFVLCGHSESVNSISYNLDGTKMVSSSNDGFVKIWSAKSGLCLKTIDVHGGKTFSAHFNTNGDKLLTSSEDGIIRIWSTTSTLLEESLTGHEGYVLSAIWNNKGDMILSAGDDKTIRLWNYTSIGKMISETQKRFRNRKLTLEERKRYYLEK